MNKTFTEFTFKNGVKLKNKLVLAPMTTYSSNVDLTLSDEEEIYYNSRAKQFGMIITAATAISKNAQGFENQISIRDGRYLESMTRLATTIKKEGSVAILQLYHGGRMNQPGLYPNQDIVSASAVKANRPNSPTPRALNTSEVYDIIDDFINATRLAIRAGFDGVEFHGANTYLIQQFFSPHSNRRNDEFGGSVIKRLKFPLTLIKRAQRLKKELNTPSFIIGYRFSPEELEIPGISLDDTMILADRLARLNVDYLHVSLGHYAQTSLREKDNTNPIINQLRDVVKNRVPIIGVGKIEDNESIKNAFHYGYNLLSVGMIALSDVAIVDHLKKGIDPVKEFSKASLLPSPLYSKLKLWLDGNTRGFTFKD